MAITAGSLRHRVTIQQLTISQDAFGGIVEAWTDLKTVWADISPLSGRE
jgi:SPP1 family predicted phage head-tail adaptor